MRCITKLATLQITFNHQGPPGNRSLITGRRFVLILTA